MSFELYESGDQLHKVCAFVDVQGFTLPESKSNPSYFKPRELTFFGDQGSISKSFKAPIDLKKFSVADRKALRLQSKNIHGFPFSFDKEGDVDRNLETELVSLYDFYRTKEKNFIAVKNDVLSTILKELGINFIDLNNPLVPSVDDLTKEYETWYGCKLHMRSKDAFRVYQCSFQIAKKYWRWIRHKQIEKLLPF